MVVNLVSEEQAAENLLRALESGFDSLSDEEMIAHVRAMYGDEKNVIAELDRIVEARSSERSSGKLNANALGEALAYVLAQAAPFFARPIQLGVSLAAVLFLISAAALIFYFKADAVDVATKTKEPASVVEDIAPRAPSPADQRLSVPQERTAEQQDAPSSSARASAEQHSDPVPSETPAPVPQSAPAIVTVDVPPMKPPPMGPDPILTKLLSQYSPSMEKLSLRLVKTAAAQGDADAQTMLGILHEKGINGGNPDLRTAVTYYKRAAHRNSFARLRLAYHYERGPVDTRNRAEAVRLYSLAAKRGDALAKERLSELRPQPSGPRYPIAKQNP